MDGRGRETTSATPRSMFSTEDDMNLIMLVNQTVSLLGKDRLDWREIGRVMNKGGRQCRERYNKYLSPGMKNGPWTVEEDALLKEKVEVFGCHWAVIVKYFPGRSDVNLKNRWSVLRRQIVEVRTTEEVPMITRLGISTTVHDFIGERDEPVVFDWFDAVSKKDDSCAFLTENGF